MVEFLDSKYHLRLIQICVWILAGMTVVFSTTLVLQEIFSSSIIGDKIIALFGLIWCLYLIYAVIMYIKQAMTTVHSICVEGEGFKLKLHFGSKKIFSLRDINEVEKVNTDKVVFVSFLNKEDENYSVRLNNGYQFFIPGTMKNLDRILKVMTQ